MLVRIVGMAAVATLGYWAIVGGKSKGGARNWLERGGRRLRYQGGPAARAAGSRIWNSTRRFLARPYRVPLSLIGRCGPYPLAVRRAAAMP